MKRFDPVDYDEYGDACMGFMEETEVGDWVKYEDALAEIERLHDMVKDLRSACEQKQEIIDSFTAVDKARMEEIEQLRQDAERYQYARDVGLWLVTPNGLRCYRNAKADREIDAAREGE